MTDSKPIIIPLHPFTTTDWDAFAGASKLNDGRGPLIGYTDDFLVIVSGHDTNKETTVEMYDEYDSRYSIDFDDVDDAVRCAEVALAEPYVFIIYARKFGVTTDVLVALEDLVARCDGEEGVRADGSNIQTMRAHAAIAKATGA